LKSQSLAEGYMGPAVSRGVSIGFLVGWRKGALGLESGFAPGVGLGRAQLPGEAPG
jgi:hypothetical protein